MIENENNMSADILKRTTKDTELLIRRIARCGVKVATVESCTGGLLSAMLTDIPGSSDWFLGGFVTYSNDAKINLVGVEKELIDEFGAVSQPVAHQMALGAMNKLNADISVSITGIAGPSGGTMDKPVGTVWIGWCTSKKQQAKEYRFHGSRQEIRMRSVHEALLGILNICEKCER